MKGAKRGTSLARLAVPSLRRPRSGRGPAASPAPGGEASDMGIGGLVPGVESGGGGGRSGPVSGVGDAVEFTVPIATESMANARLHWAVKAKKVAAQRRATAYRTPPALKALGPLLVVTLVRVAPRELDDDNLRGALKGVRDQVAAALGVDDRSRLVRWDYAQEKGESSVQVMVGAPKAPMSVEEQVVDALAAWEKSRGVGP